MAFEKTARKDWYKILGAEPSDSVTELKRKYQKLVLLDDCEAERQQLICMYWVIMKCQDQGEGNGRVESWDPINIWWALNNFQVKSYHPDKQSADVAAGAVQERVRRFIEIDQAWKILGNEETKKEYDLQQREDNLTKEWPLHAQVYLKDMSWDEDEECYTLSCRCGGSYTISQSETKEVALVCCDTCSLVIEILQ